MDELSPTDADLVSQTLAGNREAFGQLYDRYARVVRAVAVGVSGDWPAAEDMRQDSFLRAYRKLASLRDPQRFGPWIVGIARKVGRERQRALRRDRHEFRDARPWEIETPGSAEEQSVARDDWNLVTGWLSQCPEQQRVAINAYFLQEMGAQQVAELLGLSRSGFYALVQRALAHLAAQLKSSETKEKVSR
jgi:RNA polymerase sigma-70 factor, ECF subfamily